MGERERERLLRIERAARAYVGGNVHHVDGCAIRYREACNCGLDGLREALAVRYGAGIKARDVENIP